jgi:hypothetical protein
LKPTMITANCNLHAFSLPYQVSILEQSNALVN